MTPAQGHDPYIVEFTQSGKLVKVTAIDPASLREVSMMGSADVSQKQLAELAIRKLCYVLGKEQDPS